MDITGKLIKKLEKETGVTKTGKNWESQICLVDTGEKFNNIVAIKSFGEEKIKQMNKLEIGQIVTISCNVYSREYNGKYYNQIDGWWYTDQSNNPEVNKAVHEKLTGRIEMDKQDQQFMTSDNDLPF